MAEKSNPRRVIVGLKGGVRLHFPHLLEPWAGPNGDQAPKYGAMLLIDKEKAAADIEALRAAIKAALSEKGWVGDKQPTGLRLSLHDGDATKADPISGEQTLVKTGEEYRGQVYLSARSSYKPGVVAWSDKRSATEEDVVAGYYCAASVEAFTYNKNGAGVGLALGNVWITAKGEPLLKGGAKSVEEDFADFKPANLEEPGTTPSGADIDSFFA